MSEQTPYTGTGLLESMESAVNYNSHIADLLAKYCTGQLLDFGAGTGTFARRLKQRHFNVHCVEPDAMLRNRLRADGFPTYASISEAPSSFDSIYSVNVLEHIEDDSAAVRAISKALKPGGTVVIYVPAFMVLYNSVDKKIGHHRRYTATSLKKLFADFEIVRCEYADSLGFFAGLAFKMLDSGDGHVSPQSIRIYDQWGVPISKLLDVGFRNLFGKNVLLVAKKH